MKNLILNNSNILTRPLHKYNKITKLKNLTDINLLNYSNIQKLYSSRDKINVANTNFRYRNNYNTITNTNMNTFINTNKRFYNYQLQTPKVSNYTKYVNMNNISQRNLNKFKGIIANNNTSNNSLKSYPINQTYNDNVNLMSMKINVKLLEQKLKDLNDIVVPSSKFNLTKRNLTNTNTFIPQDKQRANDLTNFNTNISNNIEFPKYNFIKNNVITPRNDIKKKILDINEINNNENRKFININNSMEKLRENKLNKKYKITKNDVIKAILNINNSKDNFLNSFNNKASENITDDEELSDIADELVSTIKEKKNPKMIIDNNKNEIITDNNKIINKQTSINNNYIITNISGTVNYTPPVSKSPDTKNKEKQKNLNKKNEFVIFTNSFSINSINKEKEVQKKNEKENEGKDNNKLITTSTKKFEEEQTQTENIEIIDNQKNNNTHNNNDDNKNSDKDNLNNNSKDNINDNINIDNIINDNDKKEKINNKENDEDKDNHNNDNNEINDDNDNNSHVNDKIIDDKNNTNCNYNLDSNNKYNIDFNDSGSLEGIIKIPELLDSPLTKDIKKEDNENNESNKNFENDIHLPISSQDEINEEIKLEEKLKNKNKTPNLKYSIQKLNNTYEKKIKTISKKDDSENNSRNTKKNYFCKNNNQYNSYNKNNSLNNNKNKNIEFDDDLVYICYNEQDKPTKIKLYKINKKKGKGKPLKFIPRNNEGYIKGLSLNKKLKSILLNKEGNEKNSFSSSDNNPVVKKPKKIIKKKDIIKRNIEYIKKVEKKAKQDLVKYEKKRNNSSSRGKNKKSQEKNAKTKKIKEYKGNIKKNESLNNLNNNFLRIEPIEEEEEGFEDSKYEKKNDDKF